MNTCPACAQPVDPNLLNCPHCGISLHPGTATAGPASAGGGGGGGMSIAAIVVFAIVGIVVLLACFGAPVFWLFGARRAMVRPPAATPVASPLPPVVPPEVGASPPVELPVEDPTAESPDVQSPAEQP
jgi:hypothetical protein